MVVNSSLSANTEQPVCEMELAFSGCGWHNGLYTAACITFSKTVTLIGRIASRHVRNYLINYDPRISTNSVTMSHEKVICWKTHQIQPIITNTIEISSIHLIQRVYNADQC